MTRAAVDIIIVTWNGIDDTIQALASVIPQVTSAAGKASVTVVDNGSDDGTTEMVGRKYPDVRILRLPENRGFTGGVEAGVRASSADWIVLLNNDAIPEERWLEEYLKASQLAPTDLIAFAGKITDMTGMLIDFIGGQMTFDGHAFQTGFRRPLGGVVEPPSGSEMLFACGGNMMFRRSAYNELGGFDDDYFAYLEDVDFGWRAWLSGWRITYLPEASVRHRSSSTSDRIGNFERGVLFEKNALQTTLKNCEKDLLSEFSAPLFLTLLHRLHRYVLDRNGRTEMLRKKPFGADAPPADEWQARLRKLLKRNKRPSVVIQDDLTAMQFRAMEWFFENSERIVQKRHVVQSRRVRTDREIFARFPLAYVPTYPGDQSLMSSSLFVMLKSSLPSREMTLADVMNRDV